MSSSVAPTARVEPQSRKGLRYQFSVWAPVVLAIGCIAIESQPFLGADHTSGPLQRFVEFFTGPLRQPQWWRIHMIIRKCGHFTGYGLVSLTWFRAFWMTWQTDAGRLSRRFAAHSLAIAGTLLVASADEFHQTFLPNRSGSPWDVLIDCSGALLAQIILFLIMLRASRD